MTRVRSLARRLVAFGDSMQHRENLLAVTIKTSYPYNAFVDESVQERYGLKITGVAAYVATLENWLRLEGEWMRILRKFGMPLDRKEGHDQPFWHKTDFVARRKQFENDWPHEKRDALMERLTMTASEYTTIGISVTVNNEHFERILPSDVLGAWRDPYFFCPWGVLQSLSIMEEKWTIDLEKHKPLWFF